MRKRAVGMGIAAVVVLGAAGCGDSGEAKFEKQIQSAGMVVKDTHTEKKRRTGAGNKRRVHAYQVDVQFGRCEVTFEQRKNSSNYTLEFVNGKTPTVALAKNNPTKTDVDGYLASPGSPCVP